MIEVEYKVSVSKSKFHGYQSKKGDLGCVKTFVSSIWDDSKEDFYLFVLRLIYIIIHERICLERAFQRIKIKGGMCNPCCVRRIAEEVYVTICNFIIEET